MRVARILDPIERVREMSRRLREVERRVVVRAVGPHEGWHQVGLAGEPGFANGFTNFGSGYPPLRFFEDPDAFVYFDGYVAHSANSDVTARVFTLPGGYRPQYKTEVPAAALGAHGYVGLVSVYPSGEVHGPQRNFTFSSLIFRSAS